MDYFKTFDQLFEEKNVGIIYHFTGLRNLYKILNENAMYSHRTIGDLLYNHDPHKTLNINSNLHYLSFTRNKRMHKHILPITCPLTARIDFDGNSLSNLKYGIRSLSYFKNKMEDADESEEMLLIDGGTLNNVRKHIIKLNLPTFQRFNDELDYYLDSDYDSIDVIESLLHEIGLEDEIDDIYDGLNESIRKKIYNYLIKKVKSFGIPTDYLL